jgi:hypothetical protein
MGLLRTTHNRMGFLLSDAFKYVMKGYPANGFVLQLPESRTKIYSWTKKRAPNGRQLDC